jgi:hypothetical protein
MYSKAPPKQAPETMRGRLLPYLLACLTIVMSGRAQEGHPLKGTWLGDWGPNKTERTRVTILFDWDGRNITGALNPGPTSVPIQKASLEPKGWLVHFEVDAKDKAGKTVRYVVDGRIENLGLYKRSIVGTWSYDGVKNDFKITRQ